MKTLEEIKKEYEGRFTWKMAPSIDPDAKPPYNAPQRMIGKVLSVADNEGKIPNGIKMPDVNELWNFIEENLKSYADERTKEAVEGFVDFLVDMNPYITDWNLKNLEGWIKQYLSLTINNYGHSK